MILENRFCSKYFLYDNLFFCQSVCISLTMDEELVSLDGGLCSSYMLPDMQQDKISIRFLIVLLSSCKPVKIMSLLGSSRLSYLCKSCVIILFQTAVSKATSFISFVLAAGSF